MFDQKKVVLRLPFLYKSLSSRFTFMRVNLLEDAGIAPLWNFTKLSHIALLMLLPLCLELQVRGLVCDVINCRALMLD